MVCDNCSKKDVCKLQSQTHTLEKNIEQMKTEDYIEIEIKCKHKYAGMPTPKEYFKTPSISKAFPCNPTCL